MDINAIATIFLTGIIRSTRTRTSRNGNEIFEFSVPVSGRDDKAPSTWYRVPFFGDEASEAEGHYSEGDLVNVVGQLEVSAYAGKKGPAANVDIPFAQVRKLRNAAAAEGGVNALATLLINGNIRSTRARTSQNGNEIFEFSVPVSGRNDDDADTWYRVPYFGDAAAKAADRYSEGDLVNIVGQPEVSAYKGKNGPSASVDIPFARVLKLRSAASDGGDEPTEDDGQDVPF